MSEHQDPASILELVSEQVPKALRKNVLIVGSLAAAYHHRAQLQAGRIRTKDADIVIYPAGALNECSTLAQGLIDANWKRREAGPNPCRPSASRDPVEKLAVIRLTPPNHTGYFVELLGLPEKGQTVPKALNPCKLNDGWYCVPTFRFMSVLADDPIPARGISYARPELMALANLLSHPEMGAARVSEPLEAGGPKPLRSAKDLGRVIALARLAKRDELDNWNASWTKSMRKRFRADASALSQTLGTGLEELLARRSALDEALYTVQIGLLAGLGVNATEFAAITRQVLEDVVKPTAQNLRFHSIQS